MNIWRPLVAVPVYDITWRRRDPFDWTGLNCSLRLLVGFFCWVSWLFYQLKVDNKPESRLIHNRPGPVRCENAWYRSVTSQQRAGPEKGDCG
jgi:hypothetical protein